jgi:hypothetical protein
MIKSVNLKASSTNFSIIGRGSSDSIMSDYGLDYRAIGDRSPAGAKNFFSCLCVQTGSGNHLPSYTIIPGVLSTRSSVAKA